ncbi:MAG: nucleotidyltransferase family protein [Actinomycetia bacterium]|nr:nucleotidyltransferase family protein [Actinomycetes bacterium]
MQGALLARVVAALDHAGIDHMVTGSFASAFHGEPRMSRGIDLVVDPDATSIQIFVSELDPDRFYVDDASEALRRRDMFNVIDTETGWKADLIIRKDRPFSAEELRRRVPATIAGVDTFVASAEDTVLSKLEWSKESASEIQLRDVVAVIRMYEGELDTNYLTAWAQQLDLVTELQGAFDQAGQS